MGIGRVGRHGQLRPDRVGEDPLADRFLLAPQQQLRRALGQDDGALARPRLGVAQREHPQTFAVEGALHLQRAGLFLKVLPHEPADLAPSQAGGQFGVEEVVPELILLDNGEKGVQLSAVQHPLGAAALLGDSGALGGISGDDVGLLGVLHRLMEHGVDAPDSGAGQLIAQLRVVLDASLLLEPPVHPLDVLEADEGHLLVAQLGLDVAFDVAAVAVQGAGADGVRLVLRQPAVQPLTQSHAAVLGQVYITVVLDIAVELVQQLLLGLGVDVAENGLAVLLVTHHDAALPAAVLPLAHHPVAGWASLCHKNSPRF